MFGKTITRNDKKAYPCFIGLGSNLNSTFGTPFQTLQSALSHLEENEHIKITATSSCYLSLPHGPQNQDKFHNAVVKIACQLEPQALLTALQNIEHIHGRHRDLNAHWGARTLDLDILLFADQQINLDLLTIPHLQISNREFVLLPLMELEPELILPDGKKLKSLAEKCCQNGIIKLDQPLRP